MRVPSYEDELLNLAEDLARRLLPAFDTPTGISAGLPFYARFCTQNYNNLLCTSYTFNM